MEFSFVWLLTFLTRSSFVFFRRIKSYRFEMTWLKILSFVWTIPLSSLNSRLKSTFLWYQKWQCLFFWILDSQQKCLQILMSLNFSFIVVSRQKNNWTACHPSWKTMVQFLGSPEPGWLLCQIRGLHWYCAGKACVSIFSCYDLYFFSFYQI